MKVAVINAIPPNVPPTRLGKTSFGSFAEEDLKKQKRELDRLAADKNNPMAKILRVLAIITGDVITAGAMKLSMNKSLEIISNGLKTDAAQKIIKPVSNVSKSIYNAFKTDAKMATGSIAQWFNKSRFGIWLNPETNNFSKSVKTLFSDISKEVKEKMPGVQDVKECIINTLSILAGCGVALKETGIVDGKTDNEEEIL
ncbi:MAG: hypothetical protein PHC64_08720 [Candidatus Gastranaerophilales bacterium]|nr:hypothetical protein [Candidatus Gastranaerophilales bacterium]